MPDGATRTSSSSTRDWPGLAAALEGLDDDGLAGLLALRPDLARPAPRDLTDLAGRAGSWASARAGFLALDRAGQQVVEALCLLPQPTRLEAVADLLGITVDDADLVATLRRLEARALAFRSGSDIRLLPVLRQLDRPGRLGPPLATLLGSQGAPSVELVARRLGVDPPARSRPALVARIAEILSDPELVVRLLGHGPAGTTELARRVATDGPLVSVPAGMYRIDEGTAAGWMLNRGLLGVFDYVTAVMPREVAVVLRGGRIFPVLGLRRPELKLATVDPAAVDRAAAERALRVVTDVAAVLDQWDTDPPAVLKLGGLGIRELRRAAKASDRSETEAARLVELIGIAGLARADVLSGTVLPTSAYDDWLALDTPSRWARLSSDWLAADLHMSLAGAVSTKGKPIPPLLNRSGERDATRRRELVLAVLRRVAVGTAPEPADLPGQVDWESPSAWGGGPAPAGMLVSWVLEEADLLGVAALGALSSAGRAVVERRPADAARALAGLLPPAVDEFVLQADLTAIVAGEPARPLRSELDLLADVESTGAATVYRFSEASVRRAFDVGRTSTDILAFLEHHASRGVPQPLAYLVTDLGRRFGNVRVGAASTYLRSDDEALLTEVLQARRSAHLRLRRLAPTVLVTHIDADAVTTTLQAAGYLPAREGPDGGLHLAGRTSRRLAVEARRPAPTSPAPGTPELEAIVAGLRRAPPPPPPSSPAAPLPAIMVPRAPAAARPGEIFAEPRAVRALLGRACDEYWVVRLSYVDETGCTTELTVEPVDMDGNHLYASCFPHYEDRKLDVDRIEWARVLTEAEEELLP